jgi:hypothetical protein
VVMAVGLWAGGFLRADELAVLKRLRRARGGRGGAVATPADTTEMAGEIVSTDLPEPEPEEIERERIR